MQCSSLVLSKTENACLAWMGQNYLQDTFLVLRAHVGTKTARITMMFVVHAALILCLFDYEGYTKI